MSNRVSAVAKVAMPAVLTAVVASNLQHSPYHEPETLAQVQGITSQHIPYNSPEILNQSQATEEIHESSPRQE